VSVMSANGRVCDDMSYSKSLPHSRTICLVALAQLGERKTEVDFGH